MVEFYETSYPIEEINDAFERLDAAAGGTRIGVVFYAVGVLLASMFLEGDETPTEEEIDHMFDELKRITKQSMSELEDKTTH